MIYGSSRAGKMRLTVEIRRGLIFARLIGIGNGNDGIVDTLSIAISWSYAILHQ